MRKLTNRITAELVAQKWSASVVVNRVPQYIIYVLSLSISSETLTKKFCAKKTGVRQQKELLQRNDKRSRLFRLKAFYFYACNFILFTFIPSSGRFFFYFLRFLCLHTRRNFYAYQIKNRIKWTLHRLACVTKRLFDFPTWKCVECLHLIQIFTLAIVSDSSKCFTLDICFEVPLVSQSSFLNSSNGYVQFSTVYIIIARSKLSSPFEFISVHSK